MSEQDTLNTANAPDPTNTTAIPSTTSNQPVPHHTDEEGWKAYWMQRGQPWRTEPEIGAKQQQYFRALQRIDPDVRRGVFPFKGIKLERADVEWLLATMDDGQSGQSGQGPIDWSIESERKREGLDLRGADLSHLDLRNLPMAGLQGEATWNEWPDLTQEQRDEATINFAGADLKGAHLEGAHLSNAHFERADLRQAHLEEAILGGAHCEGAFFRQAHLEGALLMGAHLDDCFLREAHMENTFLRGAHLSGAVLENAILSNDEKIGPRVVDMHWEGVNLSVINWTAIAMLGEEYAARNPERLGRANRRRLMAEAVRANRQLAVALQSQGLNEEASRFAYRAQRLQRIVLRHQHKFGQYLFSCFLDLIAGYGYRPGRSLAAYLLILFSFAIAYAAIGHSMNPPMSPLGALIFSVISFHGRGFFPGFSGAMGIDSPVIVLAAMEAVLGLVIEISFIATFTQRFFSK